MTLPERSRRASIATTKSLLGQLGTWLGAATALWACLLGFEQTAHDLGSLQYLLSLALRASLFGTALLVSPHLVAHQAARRWKEPLPTLLAALSFAALSTKPLLAQAALLSSGDGVESSVRALIEPTLAVTLWLAAALLFAFHRRAVAAELPSTDTLKSAKTWAWYGAGVLFIVVGRDSVLNVLRSYGSAGTWLVVAIWIVAASVGFRAVRSFAIARKVAVAVLLLAIGTAALHSSASSARARSRSLALGGLAAHTAVLTTRAERPIVQPLDFAIDTSRCDHSPRTLTPVVPIERARHVLLIGIDALRSDMLDARVQGRSITPNLAAFRKRSVFFPRAITPSATTLFALGAVMTGRTLSQLVFSPRVPANLFTLLADRFEERFAVMHKGRVFNTAPFRALLVQDAQLLEARNAEATNQHTLERLTRARAQGKTSFGLLHYLDVHQPYRGHKEFLFGDGPRQRYQSEIAYTDMQLGKLLAFLEREGFFEDTLIAIYADHGESLGDPTFWGHGVLANARVADVPLLVHYPGAKPRFDSRMVSLLDLAPTVLHFAGRPIPRAFTGRSLLAPRASDDVDYRVTEIPGIATNNLSNVFAKPPRSLQALRAHQARLARPSYQRFNAQLALVTAEHRLLINRTTAAAQLFDRQRDPSEQSDRMLENPALSQTLLAKLHAWQRQQARAVYCQLSEPSAHPFDYKRFMTEERESLAKRK